MIFINNVKIKDIYKNHTLYGAPYRLRRKVYNQGAPGLLVQNILLGFEYYLIISVHVHQIRLLFNAIQSYQSIFFIIKRC